MTLVAQHCLSFFKLRQNFVWHCHSSICNALPRYTQNYCQYANWQVVGTNHQFVYHFTSAIQIEACITRSLKHLETNTNTQNYTQFPNQITITNLHCANSLMAKISPKLKDFVTQMFNVILGFRIDLALTPSRPNVRHPWPV